MSLLNKKEVKKYILAVWPTLRSHDISRVSASALEDIEAALKLHIQKLIQQHPSVGRTFRP